MRWLWLILIVLGTLAVDWLLFAAWMTASLAENCGNPNDPGGLECWGWLRDAGAELALLGVALTAAASFVVVRYWRVDSSRDVDKAEKPPKKH